MVFVGHVAYLVVRLHRFFVSTNIKKERTSIVVLCHVPTILVPIIEAIMFPIHFSRSSRNFTSGDVIGNDNDAAFRKYLTLFDERGFHCTVTNHIAAFL